MGTTRMLLASWGVIAACGGSMKAAPEQQEEGTPRAGATHLQADKAPPVRSPDCPLEQPAPDLLPGVTPDHREPGYWLDLLKTSHDLDEVLLSAEQIARLNASYEVSRPGFFSQADLLAPLDETAMRRKISDRSTWMQAKIDAGRYRADSEVEGFSSLPSVRFSPTWRVALAEAQMYCAPSAKGIYDADATSKRINRNTCSAVHAQELVQVLAPWPGSMMLVRSSTSWGFLKSNASLSGNLSESQASRFASGPWAVLSAPVSVGQSLGLLPSERLPAHTRLPLVEGKEDAVLVATAAAVSTLLLDKNKYEPSTRAFTRRAVISEALSFLGQPYGFGGLDGGIDCSRLQLDLFGAFGIKLPRFSGWQAKAGTYSIDVGGVEDAQKLRIIEQANVSGIVLMQLPGHIMLYLGRDARGTPMALHALSYYLDTCDTGEETTMVVGHVKVGGLQLGRDTRKTALLERVTRISVFGKGPPDALRDIATLRYAAPVVKPSSSQCRKLPARRLFVGPRRPEEGRILRVVATSRKDLGSARLSFFDPKGRRHLSKLTVTPGPPHGYIGTIKPLLRGVWTVVLGDGSDQIACRTFRVSREKSRPDWTEISKERKLEKRRLQKSARKLARERKRRERLARKQGVAAPSGADEETTASDSQSIAVDLASSDPVWKNKHVWNPMYEDLFAVFIERLFDYPDGDDLTWTNLQFLLTNSERNILFDYFGKSEEEVLNFVPDCADLPYTLRAYFSWKLGLPFGVHQCDRARDHRAPICEIAGGNLMPKSQFPGEDDIAVFRNFVNTHVRRIVHSSSGRTAPNAELSDFYPVSLRRQSLRPGTLFTDPYGHLLVVVKWIAQGASGYGGLIGADAQPDGTVGRRRFWRGSFLFRSETRSGGAGFKAFRPWVYDKETQSLITRTNSELKHSSTARISMEQYRGSESDFYDKMEALINPRPLDPLAKLRSLVDALDEQVARRTTSVATGEVFMKSRNFEAIEMPIGKRIFLTSGPWEDFSTPSRDWRLLIAIHTVVEFPDTVLRSPKQYGISAAQATVRVAGLRKTLAAELAKRPLSYVRSDGSRWTISLKELVDRRVAFEMAYNPNDCPEIRWAAPVDSTEIAPCIRRAPAEQRGRMLEYRHWFAERRRPPS